MDIRPRELTRVLVFLLQLQEVALLFEIATNFDPLRLTQTEDFSEVPDMELEIRATAKHPAQHNACRPAQIPVSEDVIRDCRSCPALDADPLLAHTLPQFLIWPSRHLRIRVPGIGAGKSFIFRC